MTGSEFTTFAATCVQLAQDRSFVAHRSRLLEMASVWQRLAEEAESFDRMIREMDEAFELPGVRSPLLQSQ